MKKWENFSKEELEQFVKDSTSYAQVCEKIGYKGGSGQKAVKDMIELYQFNISHFKGQGWNKDNFNYERFRYGNNIKSASIIDAIVYLRGRHCEKCGLELWLNEPIPLEVHHKDGDKLNNELDNLQLLCPNCHSLTDNWKGRNINTGKEKIPEEQYVQALYESPNIRQALLKLGLTAKGQNYIRARELIIKYNITHLLEP